MSTTFATIRSVLLIFRRLAQTGVCRIVFYDVYMKLCEEHGEKPYQLVLNLGAKSNGVVAQWAKGSTPRKKMVEAIANHFNVPVAYLLTEDESLLETKKPATEVTGNVDVIRDEIMPRVANLSQSEVIRLMGELATYMQKGDKANE